MPSKRKQINVRVTEETEARLARLLAALPAILGVQQLSQADLFSMALAELEKRYPPEQPQKRSKQ